MRIKVLLAVYLTAFMGVTFYANCIDDTQNLKGTAYFVEQKGDEYVMYSEIYSIYGDNARVGDKQVVSISQNEYKGYELNKYYLKSGTLFNTLNNLLEN